MGKLKEYTFKEDPRVIQELDRIAKEIGTSREALIRTAILNFIIQYHQKKEPKKLRVLEP
jgi:metal-responsive CopG/Arc/MetJ family transcriptional regulator